MKKLFFAGIFALLIALRADAAPGTMIDGAVVSNPVINTVLVTTGAMDPSSVNSGSACPTGGLWEITVYISSTAGAFFKIEIIDAGSVVLQTIYRGVPANASADFMPRFWFKVPTGGSVRVRNNAAITGSVQATVGFSDPQSCY